MVVVTYIGEGGKPQALLFYHLEDAEAIMAGTRAARYAGRDCGSPWLARPLEPRGAGGPGQRSGSSGDPGGPGGLEVVMDWGLDVRV